MKNNRVETLVPQTPSTLAKPIVPTTNEAVPVTPAGTDLLQRKLADRLQEEADRVAGAVPMRGRAHD